MKKELLCIKLGGSVITDKKTPYIAKKDTIRAIAKELKLYKKPLLISHGVGSFAHTSAKKYGGNKGYTDRWGIAKVAHDAMSINNIVMEIFLEEKLPVISFGPRSFLFTKSGKLQKKFFAPIIEALEQGLIPVIYGDVIWDSTQKTTIFSGEKTLGIICRQLQKHGFTISKILQLSDVDGVLDNKQKVIPEITKKNWDNTKGFITTGNVVDVTGGMRHKVEESLVLAKSGIQTIIINGNKKTELQKAIDEKTMKGTVIKI